MSTLKDLINDSLFFYESMAKQQQITFKTAIISLLKTIQKIPSLWFQGYALRNARRKLEKLNIQYKNSVAIKE